MPVFTGHNGIKMYGEVEVWLWVFIPAPGSVVRPAAESDWSNLWLKDPLTHCGWAPKQMAFTPYAVSDTAVVTKGSWGTQM
jgi:hypothetical protein